MTRIRVNFPVTNALAVQKGLEFFARMGIGQLERIVDHVRDAQLLKDADFDLDLVQRVEDRVAHLKQLMLNMAVGQSHGIHGAHVDERFRSAWAMSKAISALFDKPIFPDDLTAINVTRLPQPMGGMVIDMTLEQLALVGEAMDLAVQVGTGNLKPLMQLVNDKVLVPLNNADIPTLRWNNINLLVAAIESDMQDALSEDGSLNVRLGSMQAAQLGVSKLVDSFCSSHQDTIVGTMSVVRLPELATS